MGKRFHRSWILWRPRLVEALRFSDNVEFGKVTVTTRDFREALKDIGTEDIAVRCNGGLLLEAV